eukprot:366119-Chlamydomonas_euryale.AAC.9
MDDVEDAPALVAERTARTKRNWTSFVCCQLLSLRDARDTGTCMDTVPQCLREALATQTYLHAHRPLLYPALDRHRTQHECNTGPSCEAELRPYMRMLCKCDGNCVQRLQKVKSKDSKLLFRQFQSTSNTMATIARHIPQELPNGARSEWLLGKAAEIFGRGWDVRSSAGMAV